MLVKNNIKSKNSFSLTTQAITLATNTHDNPFQQQGKQQKELLSRRRLIT